MSHNYGTPGGPPVPPSSLPPSFTPLSPLPAPAPTAQTGMSPNPQLPADADQSYIAIWGPKSSGKTMFLFMLRDEMRAINTDWSITVLGDAASEFWEQLTDLKFIHRFPEATALRLPQEMIFQFSRRLENPPRVIQKYVKFRDMPGEWWEDRKKALTEDGINPVDAYLSQCKGLLCLIDPNANREKMAKDVDKLLMRLQTLCGKPTDKRLAICLTKMDERKHRPRRHDPSRYAREILGERIWREINNTFLPTQIACFASSSIGLYPGVGEERSNSGIDWQGTALIYEVQNIKPFGLFEPLCNWLFKD